MGNRQGVTIVSSVIAALRQNGVLLPPISTIERASIAGRARARKQTAQALTAALSAEQVDALDRIFDDTEAGGVSITLLKTIPVAAKPDHIRQILECLREVRAIGLS
jgi:hypothetical protein